MTKLLKPDADPVPTVKENASNLPPPNDASPVEAVGGRTLAVSVHEDGVSALKRLMAAAARDSPQSGSAARFLLALYDGQRFPFDLNELRAVHVELFADCICVLTMDVLTRTEIHSAVDRGGKAFEDLAGRWRVLDVVELKSAARECDLRLRGL
jgi:hypothetical protein